MGEPLGSPFLLRCADHDVEFAAKVVASGAVDAVIAGPRSAAQLVALAGTSPASLVVDAGDSFNDLEEHWAAQRDASVLCAPRLDLIEAGDDPDLEPLRRTASLTDGRPVIAPVTATLMGLGEPRLTKLLGPLRGGGAAAVALTVRDADWQSAHPTQLQQLLAVLARFAASGLPLVVEGAERLGPGLIAAGAVGFADPLPHARRNPLEGGPSRVVGYAEPRTWREVGAFRSAAPAPGLVACDWPGCQALALGRTRSDLREHRAHIAAQTGRAAEGDPGGVLESLRGAADTYVRGWGEAVAAARSVAA